MRNLSDGQRCRVVFAWLAFQTPHLLLLDEPTNHLDMETIDSLAEAILDFEGGLLLVSHDFRLINQVRITHNLASPSRIMPHTTGKCAGESATSGTTMKNTYRQAHPRSIFCAKFYSHRAFLCALLRLL